MKMFRTLIASVFSCSVLALGTLAQEAQNYKDSDFDFSLSVPAEWKSVGGEGYTVPGKLRAAFKGPGPSSIVVFVQEPGQAYDARFLLDASAEGLQKALKSDIKEKEVREIDGKKAMWLLNEGQGNGGAILGQGDVKTIQHWVAIPREKDIVVLILTCPSEDLPKASKVYDSAIKSLKIGGKQTKEQLEAK